MNNADAQLATCYGPVSRVCRSRGEDPSTDPDVDGVLSDGLIYMGNHGEELKAFNVRDGYGIRCALTSGIEVAIITGRKAKLVEDRCQTLGITHLYGAVGQAAGVPRSDGQTARAAGRSRLHRRRSD